MSNDIVSLLTGEIVEEDVELTLEELCRACEVSPEWIIELVEEGVVEPLGVGPGRWRFRGSGLRRARCAVRLQRDLRVNAAGAALALELLDEIAMMRIRLRRFGE